MVRYNTVIIGGGAAGLSAAIAARASGCEEVLLLEREPRLGGILRQCIHAGFGLERYREDLTGPEFAVRLIDEVQNTGLEYHLNSLVTHIHPDGTIEVISPERGAYPVKADRFILATGALERTRENQAIAGTRPAGVYTGGQAQQLINIHGLRIGHRVVVQGSGDIGLIISRRLMLEGYEVVRVLERLPVVAGLARNKVLCLEEFDRDVTFRTQVTEIHGRDRVSGVTASKLDAEYYPIPGTEEFIECDTVVFSAGLIPDCRLGSQLGPNSTVPVVPVGNAREIHATADEAARDGENRIHATVDTVIAPESIAELQETNEGLLCVICPKGCILTENDPGCEKGRKYLNEQRTARPRVLTTTAWRDGMRVAVRSRAPIALSEHRDLVQSVQAPVNGHEQLFTFTEIARWREY